MDKVSGRLTVFFEEPFWIGVFERISEGKLSVCKVTFGAEPKDYEVYDFVLRNYYRLKFSPAVATDVKEAGRNPKRVQRDVRKQVQNTGFERISEGKLSACKVTFGAEPKDYEIYEFVLKNYYRLKFSPAVATDVKEASRNPKRVQRDVRKQVQNTGIGTKSQQALKLQQEQFKTERKAVSREQREAEKQRQFELKQQKRKEKI